MPASFARDQFCQRKALVRPELLAQIAQHAVDPWMNFRQPALAKQALPEPRFARLAQRGTAADGAAPVRQFERRHRRNGLLDARRQRSAQRTVGIDERDEHGGVARVHFVRRVGPHQGGAAAQPALSRAAADAQYARARP
jgi:hypothetical protein